MRIPKMVIHHTIPMALSRINSLKKGDRIQMSQYATTSCNFNTGEMNTNYANAAAYGPRKCLELHENMHRRAGYEACKRYQKCINNLAVPNANCHNVFNQWFNNTENRDECGAYSTEARCLLDQLKDPSVSAGDKDTIKTRLHEANQYKQQYCVNGRSSPPPFKHDGTIM